MLTVAPGSNRFTGDLHNVSDRGDCGGDIGRCHVGPAKFPAWRPGSGYMLFGADRSLEFAWLPSVPQGAVTVRYTVDGEQHETTGSATTITTGAMSA